MIKRLTALLAVFLIILSIIPLQQAAASPKSIVVPDNYPSITAAIANALDGDIIYIRSGVYNEAAFSINKSITVRGENVINTIVKLEPPLENFTDILGHIHPIPSVAITINANNVKISGLTIASKGGISANGNGIELISNFITIGRSCSITGLNTVVARNTLTGDNWRMAGSYLTLADNTINAASNGIESNGSYCNIHGNNINGTLVIWGSMNNIVHNIFELMFIFYGDSNTIQDNSGEISLGNSDRSCSNNVVSGNLMKGPAVWGIWLGTFCRNNVFSDNYIVDEGYDQHGKDYNSGVILCNTRGIGTNNTFYHNVFVNNSVNVKFYNNITTGGNFWDNGIQGNYWSDYHGSDVDNDGIGDTPYVIDSANSDSHPLITPFNEPSITIAPPVYDPPINIPASTFLPQATSTPAASTPMTDPTKTETTNPTAQPTESNNPDSSVMIPEFAFVVIPILASVILIALIAARRLEKSKKP